MTFGVYLECYSLTSATSEDARMFLYTTTTDCAFYPQSHKMSLNKKNLPRSRILGTFINDFSKLFCVCWRKKECVKRFSKMFWLNRSWFIRIYILKVHIFWEGHKILRNFHRKFDWHDIEQIYSGDFSQNFVTFLEYRISANSFRGNYSFLTLTLCIVTFDLSA